MELRQLNWKFICGKVAIIIFDEFSTWCKCGATKKKKPLRIASERFSSTQSRSTKYIFAYSYFILNSLIIVYIVKSSVK